MAELPLPITFFEGAQEHDPTLMEHLEQRERSLDGCAATVGEFGPEVFFVRLDGGHFFGEGKLEAYVTIHVAVGDMVHHLPHSPATGPIRRFELRRRQPLGRGSEAPRCSGELVNKFAALIFADGFRAVKFADRITQVCCLFSGGHADWMDVRWMRCSLIWRSTS